MHLIAISLVVQLLCAVHCVRNGRNGLWLMLIFFLSIPGCLDYAWFEILPQYAARREVRTVKQAAAKVIDPDRDVRDARDALDTADTAANRIAMGDALGDQGKWAEAILHYEEAAAKAPGRERSTELKLARACLEAGAYDKARRLLEALPESGSQAETDRGALLLARTLEALGEVAPALALYAEVGERMPGAEAQCRRAALLLSEGRRAEALPVLAEVERRAKRMDRYERSKHSDMFDWAERELAELRGGQAGA